MPVGSFEVCVSEDLPEEVAELSEPIDDDETERVLLQADVVLPFEAPAWESRQCLLEALAVRALTPFRLRAFSGRGSPVA